MSDTPIAAPTTAPILTAAPRPTAAPTPTARPTAAKVSLPVPLQLEVVWGDITRVPGDMYVVGHYNGVEPQGAELALDRHVVSRMPEARRGSERLTLTRLSHLGQLAPDFGDIEFFPGDQRGEDRKSVV